MVGGEYDVRQYRDLYRRVLLCRKMGECGFFPMLVGISVRFGCYIDSVE